MTWETMTGLSSALIALCALGLTVWQAKIARQHNRLSVTPHLTTWFHRDSAHNRYSVELLNNGIGPALIESFHIQVDGQPLAGEGLEPIEKALKILFPQYQHFSAQSYLDKGYMMAEKEVRNLVMITFQGEKMPTAEEVENEIKRARLLITYKSIYQDDFTLDTSTLRANPTLQGTPPSERP